MLRVLVELRKKVNELMAKFECRKLEEGKVKDLTCKWVENNSKLMEYFIIAPSILGGYVLKRNHHVSSLDLNRSTIYAIYLSEMQKMYDIMT